MREELLGPTVRAGMGVGGIHTGLGGEGDSNTSTIVANGPQASSAHMDQGRSWILGRGRGTPGRLPPLCHQRPPIGPSLKGSLAWGELGWRRYHHHPLVAPRLLVLDGTPGEAAAVGSRWKRGQSNPRAGNGEQWAQVSPCQEAPSAPGPRS